MLQLDTLHYAHLFVNITTPFFCHFNLLHFVCVSISSFCLYSFNCPSLHLSLLCFPVTANGCPKYRCIQCHLCVQKEKVRSYLVHVPFGMYKQNIKAVYKKMKNCQIHSLQETNFMAKSTLLKHELLLHSHKTKLKNALEPFHYTTKGMLITQRITWLLIKLIFLLYMELP